MRKARTVSTEASTGEGHSQIVVSSIVFTGYNLELREKGHIEPW